MKQTSVFSKHGQIFLTVAEQLSVVKASDVLGMKQSSISYHLNQLEKELNVPLLDRRTKPISLTPEGKLLFDELSYEQRHLTEFLSKLQQKTCTLPLSDSASSKVFPIVWALTLYNVFSPRANI